MKLNFFKACKAAAVGLSLAACVGAVTNAEAAPNFPRKQIQIVVPYAPGGASDVVARIYGKELEGVLGKPVIIVNRTGASGAIGLESVKNARPDGYTMSYMPVESTMLKALGIAEVSSDDFDFVCRIMTIPAAITVSADAPWNTLDEFLTYAKENPGKVLVGNSGSGSIWHVAAASLAKAAGVEFTHVPFDGAAPAIAGLLGKNITAVAVSPAEVKANVDAGQFKVLAVIGDAHSSVVPDVKTTRELGYDVTAMGWGGFAVPKGTPEEVVQILSDASAKVAQSENLKSLLKERGFEYAPLTGTEMNAFAKDQLDQYSQLIPELLGKK